MNKTVIVTGSSRGIGLKTAECFFSAGYNVLINCLKNDTAARAAADNLNAKAAGNAADYFTADVSDYEACKAMVSYAQKRFGKIDVLINNAGMAQTGLFTELAPACYKRVIEVNLISAFNMSHLVLPGMVQRKNGCIINISSVWGGRGASCEAVYAASKAGLEGFTKSLAKEYGPCGIRINGIACGVIDTEMNNNLSTAEKEDLKYQIPLDRFGTADEIAKTALFLASSGASYITGAIIAADGGF